MRSSRSWLNSHSPGGDSMSIRLRPDIVSAMMCDCSFVLNYDYGRRVLLDIRKVGLRSAGCAKTSAMACYKQKLADMTRIRGGGHEVLVAERGRVLEKDEQRGDALRGIQLAGNGRGAHSEGRGCGTYLA